ncbi:MAG: alkaline phosphatase family protein [Acidobacteria bacterium]|nr:alkaline phosphatase family protein [Acidobacteriota bacterium]
MKQKLILLGLLFFTTALFAQSRSVPVVLISIDGLKPDYILEADKHQLKIPHLRKMLADGAHAKAVTGILPTVTYPSHTTMLTGVSPSKHGILYNTPFDPFGKNQSGWMWYAEDIKSLTLWEAVNKAGGVTSSVDWPVSVGAPVKNNIVQIWRATTDDDHKLLKALSTPGLLNEAEKSLGLSYPAGYIYTVESDTRRAAFNAWMIEHKKPRFHTAYFSVLDEVQHNQGPYTPEAYATIEALDGMIGKVWQAAVKADPRAVVCVVSDHGFARYDKAININSALRAAGLIELDAQGKLKSWQAITWGSGAIMLNNPNDTEARSKVRDVLQGLAENPASGIAKVIDNDEAKRMGGFPDAAFVVFVKPGYTIGSNFDGPVLRSTKPGGTHGLWRDLPEMDSSFFIAGAGIPKGRTFDRIDMRDIAPTLAGLLDVSLPMAEGRNLFKK